MTPINHDAPACNRCALETDLRGLSINQALKQGGIKPTYEHSEGDCIRHLRDGINTLIDRVERG